MPVAIRLVTINVGNNSAYRAKLLTVNKESLACAPSACNTYNGKLHSCCLRRCYTVRLATYPSGITYDNASRNLGYKEVASIVPIKAYTQNGKTPCVHLQPYHLLVLLAWIHRELCPTTEVFDYLD
jgi:hypothetical protein